MAVFSMTGFARCEGRDEASSWAWEVKSVNGRSLDIRCRLAPGAEMLEPEARGVIEQAIVRGHVSVNLKIARTAGQVRIRINEAALTQVMEAVSKLDLPVGVAPPGLDGLLRLNGVTEIEEVEESEADRRTRVAAMIADLGTAVADLCAMRADEGARLAQLVVARLARLGDLVETARAAAQSQPQAIRQRLLQRLDEWLNARPALPEDRLAQEVALLVVKADVTEELDRLDSHITAARGLLTEGGAIGRRLDFLSQELSREANTLCAKAAARDLGDIGLEIKVVADQIREQIQNIE